jgi:hypothetical protein
MLPPSVRPSCSIGFALLERNGSKGARNRSEDSYGYKTPVSEVQFKADLHSGGRPGGSDWPGDGKEPVAVARTRVPVAGVTSHQQMTRVVVDGP